MIGTGDEPLFYTGADMQAIRDRMGEIQARIRERASGRSRPAPRTSPGEAPEAASPVLPAAEEATRRQGRGDPAAR